MVQNSVVVWIFMGTDVLGAEFHSCADFYGHGVAGYGIP